MDQVSGASGPLRGSSEGQGTMCCLGEYVSDHSKTKGVQQARLMAAPRLSAPPILHRAWVAIHLTGARGKMRSIPRGVNMGVVENVKDVAELIKKFGDIELNRRILKLEEEVLDLSRDKRRAEKKVEELEAMLKVRKQIIFRDPHYFVVNENGTSDGPYCSIHWDRDQKLARMQNRGMDGLVCPVCLQDRLTKRM
jgi:hypothetical protein